MDCMEKVTYTVNIKADEEGGFVATVPALPGCVTQGETYDEVIQMAHECIEGFLEALAKAGEPIPTEPLSSPISPIGIRVNAPVIA